MTTIPGVETIHERSVWEPVGFRMALDFTTKPGPLWLPNCDRASIHHTADDDLPDGDFGEFIHQLPAYLAAITVSYYVHRTGGGYTRRSDGRYFTGYPVGYSFAVDWLGGVWVLRGFDFVPAATGGHNGHTIAILLLTDLNEHGTAEMWASVRAIQREANRRGARLADRPWGHGEFRLNTGIGTPTDCPSRANLSDIHAGLGDISYTEPVQEDDMALYIARSADFNDPANRDDPWIVVGPSSCRPATTYDTETLDVPTIDIPDFTQYANLVVAAGLPRPVR